MAEAGLKPVFAVYSTFLQRGYDQLLHDVCLQKLPVVFAIDRAGLVGADGETHQGVYDIAYFTSLPNGLKLFSPSSVEELRAMLDYALELGCPAAIRYNRGILPSRALNSDVPMDKWELITDTVKQLTIVATGRLLSRVINLVENDPELKNMEIGIVNARLLCPIDDELLDMLTPARVIITVEDGSRDTGFGAQIARIMCSRLNSPRVVTLGVPSIPIEAGSVDEQDEFCGLSEAKLAETIKSIAAEMC